MSPTRHVPQCAECGTAARGFFCSLAGKHLRRLDREKVAHRYNRGQPIFYEGTPPTAIHCIYSGSVKLYKTGEGDAELMIRLLGPGDIMGYRAVLAGENYAATAQAVEDSVVCTISKATVFDLIKSDTELAIRLLAKLATELRVSEDQMMARSTESVAQRTARFLVWVLEGSSQDTSRPVRLPVPLRREEMAQMIGTTPETLSRVLGDLARRGVIELDRKSITVVKSDRLYRAAEGRET